MKFYAIKHSWQNTSSPESVILSVHTSRDAAWQEIHAIARHMGATDVPDTPQRGVRVLDSDELMLVLAMLNDDDSTIPSHVFFLERWDPAYGHRQDEPLARISHKAKVRRVANAKI